MTHQQHPNQPLVDAYELVLKDLKAGKKDYDRKAYMRAVALLNGRVYELETIWRGINLVKDEEE
jgi:hypothetical protein